MPDLIRHPVAEHFEKAGFRVKPGMTKTPMCVVFLITTQSLEGEERV